MKIGYLTSISILAATLTSGVADAATIDLPPDAGNDYNYISANFPQFGSVWTGLAQSFIAQDSSVYAGFYMINPPNASPTTIMYSLYAGNGQFTTLLDQQLVLVALGRNQSGTALANFTGVTLTPGNSYTLEASLPGQRLPTAGTYVDLGVEYASPDTDLLPGGNFYVVGPNETTFPRTIALEVTPVPLPGALSLFGSALIASMVFARHRRKRAA